MSSGQTIVEYIIIIGLVVTMLFVMGPALKRGSQSLIKSTADQLGVQNQAEQDFSPGSGAMVNSLTSTRSRTQRDVSELIYSTNTAIDQSTETSTQTITNMGFTKD